MRHCPPDAPERRTRKAPRRKGPRRGRGDRRTGRRGMRSQSVLPHSRKPFGRGTIDQPLYKLPLPDLSHPTPHLQFSHLSFHARAHPVHTVSRCGGFRRQHQSWTRQEKAMLQCGRRGEGARKQRKSLYKQHDHRHGNRDELPTRKQQGRARKTVERLPNIEDAWIKGRKRNALVPGQSVKKRALGTV